MHICPVRFNQIRVPIQVKQPVNDVKQRFLLRIETMLRPFTTSRINADQNLSVVKGDDISRRWIIHEHTMDFPDCFIGYQGNLDFLQAGQNRLFRSH